MTPKELAQQYEAKVFETPDAAEAAGFVLTETMTPRASGKSSRINRRPRQAHSRSAEEDEPLAPASSDVPVEDGTTPSEQTPDDVAAAQRQLKLLQWAVPALTGALVVVSAFAGEQQRPAAFFDGLRRRITG